MGFSLALLRAFWLPFWGDPPPRVIIPVGDFGPGSVIRYIPRPAVARTLLHDWRREGRTWTDWRRPCGR